MPVAREAFLQTRRSIARPLTFVRGSPRTRYRQQEALYDQADHQQLGHPRSQ